MCIWTTFIRFMHDQKIRTMWLRLKTIQKASKLKSFNIAEINSTVYTVEYIYAVEHTGFEKQTEDQVFTFSTYIPAYTQKNKNYNFLHNFYLQRDAHIFLESLKFKL